MGFGGLGDMAQGALAGGAIGGPWGALAGAAGGFLLGGGSDDERRQYDPNYDNFMLPGYGQTRGQYDSMIGQGPRGAPQAGMSGFRGGQQQLSSMLFNQARGQGPGQEIARRQAAQQVEQGMGQQMAMARSARPGQSAMAARNAAMASGQLQGAGAQAASMGGLAAQQSAIGQLGGVLQGARGQDLQRNIANAGMRQQQMSIDDARQMELLRQRLQMDRFQQMGGMGYEQARMGGANLAAQQPSDWDKILGAAQGFGQARMLQGAGSMGGGQYIPSMMSSYPGGYSGMYGSPQSYEVPKLQTSQLWNQGGFGSNLGQPGPSLGVPQLNQPYAGNPNSGAMSGFAVPRLR